MSESKKCVYHAHNDSVTSIMVEGGGVIEVCQRCKDRILGTEFICKHCHIPIVSRTDTRAILGREHKKGCPRHNR